MKPFRSEFLDIRGYRIHTRHWGDAAAPLLFMLHGWGDMSASWQFVVDELKRDWHIVAPDWRGCGQSEFHGTTYYFPEYLADLEAILDHYSPAAPVRIVAHSMGGNAACLYAGIRPERVAHIVNLEGTGLWRTKPEDAPGRYAKWLDEVKKVAPFRSYPDRAALAARLRRDNPRLTPERAEFLATHFGVDDGQGGIRIALDPAHRLLTPILYRVEEAKACWHLITAPVLWVTAADSQVFKKFFPYDSDEHRQRIGAFPDIREVHLPDCSHNMHHDQPEVVAHLIEDFLP